MSEDNRVAEFLARNKVFAANHKPQPFIDGPGGLRENPAPHPVIVIISCMDVRVMREAFFGLRPGEATVYSNAGGRVNADTLRSIYCLEAIVGVGTVIVVHHTDCGLTHSTDDSIRMKLKERVGPEKADEVDAMTFGEIKNMKQSIEDDVNILRASPYLKKDLKVFGFLFDITKASPPLTEPTSQNATSPAVLPQNMFDYHVAGTRLILRITETGLPFTKTAVNTIVDAAIRKVVAKINAGFGAASIEGGRFYMLNKDIDLRITALPDNDFTYFLLGDVLAGSWQYMSQPWSSFRAIVFDIILDNGRWDYVGYGRFATFGPGPPPFPPEPSPSSSSLSRNTHPVLDGIE
ncbi:MAG: hypothetical protein ASARMPRED_002230 [Alectoria sarmentosa]|nr:MAG: hypothetical protein ASARMPRED_002230 [Alectoria sarmentosa]